MKKLSRMLLVAFPSFLSFLPAEVTQNWNWDLDCDKQIIAFLAPLSARMPRRLTDNRMTGKSAISAILTGDKQIFW